MIDDAIIDQLIPKVIEYNYRQEKKIGLNPEKKEWDKMFYKYPDFWVMGNLDCFIVYDKIGDISFIVDVVSNNGKMYYLFSKFAKMFSKMITWAYEELPIVKRAYPILGFMPFSRWNKQGQRMFVRGVY